MFHVPGKRGSGPLAFGKAYQRKECIVTTTETADQVRPEQDVPMLQVRGLWKIFGDEPAKVLSSDLRNASKDEIQEKTGQVVGLREITFDVAQGEIFVLMGLSGSGKSTLIRNLIRLVEPSAGEVIIGGTEICSLDAEQY